MPCSSSQAQASLQLTGTFQTLQETSGHLTLLMMNYSRQSLVNSTSVEDPYSCAGVINMPNSVKRYTKTWKMGRKSCLNIQRGFLILLNSPSRLRYGCGRLGAQRSQARMKSYMAFGSQMLMNPLRLLKELYKLLIEHYKTKKRAKPIYA